MLQLQKYDFSIVDGDTTNLKLTTSHSLVGSNLICN